MAKTPKSKIPAKVAKKLDAQITLDRRARTDRRGSASSPAHAELPKAERRVKVPRRRQIDPTTCEREYTPEEIEFMHAMDAYKRSSGRMFPTCSEVLEVIRNLGYEKQTCVTASVNTTLESLESALASGQ